MTHQEIASAILNNLTAGEGITNIRVPLQQIRDEIDSLRARILMEKNQQGFPVDMDYYQPVSCLPVECKDISDCCIDINTGEKVLQVELPSSPVYLNGKPLIQYVGIVDRSRPFRIIDGKQNVYAFHNKFMKNVPTLWVDGTRGIIFNPTTTRVKYITISAVWANPSKVADLECCSEYENEDYPAPPGIVDTIIGKTTQSYLRYYYARNPLQSNDQVDNPGEASRQQASSKRSN